MTPSQACPCPNCGAVLSQWEKRCACDGPWASTIREVLYAVACAAEGPIHVRDFVRNARRDFGLYLTNPTANATLGPDRRFCWAGKGLYGLFRHGPLPGPRNLEEAARVLLVAAGEPLSGKVVHYCLKRMGYHYNEASLQNAVARSNSISRDWYGVWSHPQGEAAERDLRSQVPVVPPRARAAWTSLRDDIGRRVHEAAADRAARLRAAADTSRFGLNWEQ